MKTYTYALIEDEPPARSMLKHLMEDVAPGSRCLGEAADGIAGLDLLRSCQPNVLFLDIEFPPEGAFSLLEEARRQGLALPPIVFTTAYDAHALEAFRWAACDYLLKPVEPEALQEALRRLGPRLELDQLLTSLQATREHRVPEHVTVNVKGRLRRLAWSEVLCIQTENRLVFAQLAKERFILDWSLEELEKLLEPAFLRIHRSILVNLAHVQELDPNSGHTSELHLIGGETLAVSRDRLATVRRALGGKG